MFYYFKNRKNHRDAETPAVGKRGAVISEVSGLASVGFLPALLAMAHMHHHGLVIMAVWLAFMLTGKFARYFTEHQFFSRKKAMSPRDASSFPPIPTPKNAMSKSDNADLLYPDDVDDLDEQ